MYTLLFRVESDGVHEALLGHELVFFRTRPSRYSSFEVKNRMSVLLERTQREIQLRGVGTVGCRERGKIAAGQEELVRFCSLFGVHFLRTQLECCGIQGVVTGDERQFEFRMLLARSIQGLQLFRLRSRFLSASSPARTSAGLSASIL